MKIGILTFHRSINYGAVTQCYALATEIKKRIPYSDVEVIDYVPRFRKEKYIPSIKNYLFGSVNFDKSIPINIKIVISQAIDLICHPKNLRLLKERYNAFSTSMESLPLSDEIYEDNDVFDYCKKNDIQFICYQPLRRGRTAKRNYPLLVELSKKYNKTQNQIILNWICKEKNIFSLIKSTSVDRINENIQSLDFEMSREDYERMNRFRSSEFDSISIDWEGNSGVSIDQLANQFD